jgi:hypothetical protein
VPTGSSLIRWFGDRGLGDIPLVGVKNASLGEIHPGLSGGDVPYIKGRVADATRAVRVFVRETACAIGGHNYLLHAAGGRICLRCAECGHETPGWRVGAHAE